MATARGKVQVAQGSRPHWNVGGRKLKIYSDNSKVKIDANSTTSSVESNVPPRKKSVPIDRGVFHTNANDSKGMKGNSKITEKIKGKQDNSGIQQVRRKPLADLSNAQSSYSKNVVFDGSKPKISVGPGFRIASLSSRKSSLEKERDNQNQRIGVNNSMQRGIKALRISSDDKRTNTKSVAPFSAANNGRKSLPVLRRMSKAEINSTKNAADNSEAGKRTSGFPVKAKAVKKIPQVSTGRGHLWGNRVSDGFIIMTTKDQNNVDARKSSGVSMKPVGKAANRYSIGIRSSRSKGRSSANEYICATAIASDQSIKPAFMENAPVLVSHDPAQEETSSDSNRNSTANKSEAVAKRKPSHRRSYTSLLMARSKLLREHGEVLEEKLPSIDNNCNQLEVAEYVHEIYQYYWVSEAQNISLANYMSFQTDVSPQMRGILINWLIEVHFKFELMPETLYLTVTLLDQYLSQVKIKKNEMQLVGLTALLLASKYEDYWHPRIGDLISISAESYTRDQVLAMEKFILKKLKFRLNAPTPYVFMLRFLKAAQSDLKLEHLAFYLIELSLVEYEALKFKPSMLCASAVFVARLTLQIDPAWTPLLAKHARYEVSEIRDCAEMILRFQKAASTSQLKVTHEKYMRPDLSRVAAIEPLDKLS